jgi:hypothetical protein
MMPGRVLRNRGPGYAGLCSGAVSRAARSWCLGLALALSSSSTLWAQTPGSKSRVVTISEVTIVGRIQKPIAAVDVSRIAPKLTLAELRQPFLQRIEAAIYRSPF